MCAVLRSLPPATTAFSARGDDYYCSSRLAHPFLLRAVSNILLLQCISIARKMDSLVRGNDRVYRSTSNVALASLRERPVAVDTGEMAHDASRDLI